MDNHFGGVIWTNHAIDRMRERGIKQGDAWATWNRPEQSYKTNLHKGEDAYRYYRTYGNERIEVVARKNEKGEWIIISVWSDPLQSSNPSEIVKTSHGAPFGAHSATKLGFWRWLYNQVFRV